VQNIRDSGKCKIDLVKNAWKDFNPCAEIECYKGSAADLPAQELLKGVDLIVLAVDNDPIRAILNGFASQYAIPLVNVCNGIWMNDDGSKIEGQAGQVQWFFPREHEFPCLSCHGSLNQQEIQENLMPEQEKKDRKKAGYIFNTTQSPAPQVIPLNTIIAGIAVDSIVGWIVGYKKTAALVIL